MNTIGSSASGQWAAASRRASSPRITRCSGPLLAERGGVDPDVAAEIMGSSPTGSPMLKARIPLLLDLPDQAWFDIELMYKDIRLARQAASEVATPVPSAEVGDEMLTRASELGYGHRDLAALHEVLAGTPPEPAHPGRAA